MMISFARAGPTRRTNRVVDATPRGTPRSTSGIQSCASAAAQRKSQASVRPHPPPTAWPLIMAIVVCSRVSSIVLARSKSRRNWLFRWPKAARRSSADMADLRAASGARLCEEPERRLRGPEAREKRRGRRAEMARRDLGEKGAEVRRHGEVTALEELVAGEPGPAPVHAAAAHTAAENEHRRRMTVGGPPVAVLRDGPAELPPRDHDHVRPLAAEVLSEGRERPPELAEAERELPALGALADVGIPALHVGERDLEADARLDELAI